MSPLTEALATAGAALEAAQSAAKAAILIESALAIVAKRLHDADTFTISENQAGDGLEILIKIPKFKPKPAPEVKPTS